MTEQLEGQMTIFDLDSQYGKMFQELLSVMEEKISDPFYKRSAMYAKKEIFQFLNLRRGGWESAGCILGECFSIAWRVYDAQYWGVPQRRKRIYLIADFAGERAGEILFEQEGVCWNSETCRKARENASRFVEGGNDGSDWFRWMK